MRFLVLGPLEVAEAGEDPLPIAGSKERTILACLIARAGQVVVVGEYVGGKGVCRNGQQQGHGEHQDSLSPAGDHAPNSPALTVKAAVLTTPRRCAWIQMR